MDKLFELIRIVREVGLKRFLKVLRINRQIVPLVQGFALTQVIGSLQQLGFFETLAQTPSTTEEMVQRFSVRPAILEPLLHYLLSAGVLHIKGGRWHLSNYGKFVTLEHHGLFLLFRAYTPIFTHLNPLLKGEIEYGTEIHRDEKWMAIGSSQIVQWLPIPVVKNWLAQLNCRLLIDIGCGAGDFIGQLNESLVDCKMVGVDRSPAIIELAKTKNPGQGKKGPITYFVVDAMNALDLDRLRRDVPQADAITIMFVLHELVYVSFDVALKFLTNLRKAYPSAHLFVCEIMQPDLEKRAKIRSGSELLLYHALSNQRPLPLEDWVKLFTQAGYAVEEKKTFELMSQAYFRLNPIPS